MTGPSGNSEFCFPSTSMFPSATPRGTLRVSGKQNSLFPLWPVIKCLITYTALSSTFCRRSLVVFLKLPNNSYYAMKTIKITCLRELLYSWNNWPWHWQPNYANVLETGMDSEDKSLFFEPLHSFLEWKNRPFPRIHHSSLVPPVIASSFPFLQPVTLHSHFSKGDLWKFSCCFFLF